jgi:muramoyltetrapeptide carboxypeptidase
MARKPGIGLIAPSGQVLDSAALERSIGYFKSNGWRVVAPAAVRAVQQRFAGTDAARVAALHAMAARNDVDLVMAVRGGYGLSRLLGTIDFGFLSRSGKTFVGHSDFTALLCAGYSHGMAGIAGPMACYDFGAEAVSPFTEAHFRQLLEGREEEITLACESPPGAATGKLSGRLWGGNLALVAHLAGTPWLPRIRGGILFVEDVNEHPYRIERMIYQLLHAGILARQKALLLGDFSAYQLAPNDNGFDFDRMVEHLRAVLPIPVLTGLPFGHVRDKLSLPFGARAELAIGWHEYRLRYAMPPREAG